MDSSGSITMKVRLINFHYLVDIDLLLKDHGLYVACTNLLKIKEGPSMYLTRVRLMP